VPRPKKKISQARLARELDLSQALVSLVLNGRKQGVHTATYDRIWAHALKRGYKPKGMHLAASPAAPPRSVGFIIRAPLRLDTPSLYFGHVQQGLHATLEHHGLAAVFIGAEDQLDAAKLSRVFAPDHAFQGIALIGEVARPFLDQLRALGLRIVAVSARYPGLCHSVLGNEPQALEALVKHLHGLGHRRFGWLGGNIGLGRHESRLNALGAALGAAGLKLDPRYCVKLAAGDRAEGAEAVHALARFFQRRDFPTAFISYNSLMAAGAIRAFERAGLAVPRDLSVASADFSSFATQHAPRITAAGSNPEKLGEAAARLIAGLGAPADAESFTDLMLPAQLFVGDTTGPARGA
jgi:LacI family transcriptional regulator